MGLLLRNIIEHAELGTVTVEMFYNDSNLRLQDIIYSNPTDEYLHISIKNDQGDELVEWEQKGPGSGTIQVPNIRCVEIIEEGQTVVDFPPDITHEIEWG